MKNELHPLTKLAGRVINQDVMATPEMIAKLAATPTLLTLESYDDCKNTDIHLPDGIDLDGLRNKECATDARRLRQREKTNV